jgi:hypothetical protein
MRSSAFLTIPVLWLLSSSSAFANAPAAAYNKTITISFTSSGTRTDSLGKSAGFSTQVSRIIYVSSNGRLFMRHIATSMAKGRRSRGGDFAPDSGRGGSFAFQGNRLVGTMTWAAGARQITATFDPGFTSCTATVIDGRAEGGTIRRRAPSGEMVEVTSVSNSAPSCSIQSGNAFAQ